MDSPRWFATLNEENRMAKEPGAAIEFQKENAR